MRKGVLPFVLAAAGSALCWWPFLIAHTPNRSHLWFLPYPFIALLTGYLTFLSGGRWFRIAVATTVGTFFGVCVGGAIWPNEDGIAQSYLLYGAGMATLVVALVSSLAGLVGRMFAAR